MRKASGNLLKMRSLGGLVMGREWFQNTPYCFKKEFCYY
ncbi:hypothetical protein HPHPP1_0872 [Helicobacter pylori Hp P-1]|nr:hypothetical protein HPHPP1_0872 [Helicobacter pylori Hp P-1]EJC20133.1 hypothetical protein HPHPP1B_0952 [Helicobacter pylori Hp P-1b]